MVGLMLLVLVFDWAAVFFDVAFETLGSAEDLVVGLMLFSFFFFFTRLQISG